MGSIREKQQLVDNRRYGLEVIFISRYSKSGYVKTNQVLFITLKVVKSRAEYRSHCFILQVVINRVSGAPSVCFGSIDADVIMKPETIELVIMKGCCGLRNEAFECVTFAVKVN